MTAAWEGCPDVPGDRCMALEPIESLRGWIGAGTPCITEYPSTQHTAVAQNLPFREDHS